MTDLFWGFGEIPRNAAYASMSVSPSALTTAPSQNLGLGTRRRGCRTSTTATTCTIRWDLTADRRQGANFLYLGNLLRMFAAYSDLRVRLEYSSDDSAWTAAVDLNPVTSANLVGPRSEDYIGTFTATSAYRYWRLRFTRTGGGSLAYDLSKAFFGTSFDFGRNPLWESPFKRRASAPGQRDARYSIQLAYGGITNAKLADFEEYIGIYADFSPVVLFTTDVNELLDSQGVLLMMVEDMEVKPVSHNNNAITLTLIEDI